MDIVGAKEFASNFQVLDDIYTEQCSTSYKVQHLLEWSLDHADTEQCLEGHMIVERNSIQVSVGLYNLFEHCSVYMSSNTWKFDANSFAPY